MLAKPTVEQFQIAAKELYSHLQCHGIVHPNQFKLGAFLSDRDITLLGEPVRVVMNKCEEYMYSIYMRFFIDGELSFILMFKH
jgi:hypothetical protein